MRRTSVQRSTLVLLCVVIFTCCGRAQDEALPDDHAQAVVTLQHYIQLRLQDADWKEYSKLITWPDEPSWDCKWVVSKHKVGAPVSRGKKVVIPVTYNRLGLFCYDFKFKPKRTLVTIDYKLVHGPSGWKVNAPIPDYPDITDDVLIKSVDATAKNANETPERRAEAEAAARKITEAIKLGNNNLPKPKGDQ